MPQHRQAPRICHALIDAVDEHRLADLTGFQNPLERPEGVAAGAHSINPAVCVESNSQHGDRTVTLPQGDVWLVVPAGYALQV